MEFLYPWGLLGLLALPAIVALHLFRRRYEPRKIATLMLWQSLRGQDTQGLNPQPLRSSLSLWLQLLAALLLTLLLSGPRILRTVDAVEVIIVVDSAYALQARQPDGRTAADALRGEMIRRLEGRSGQPFTVIEHGHAPRLLTARRASAAEARRALADWNPAQPRAPWGTTLRLLQSWDIEEALVWVFSDTLSNDWQHLPGVAFTALGKPAGNLALIEPSRIRMEESGTETLRVNLHNYGAQPVSTELRLHSDGQAARRWPVTVQANGVLPLSAEIAASDQVWRLELPDDALPFDNRAELTPRVRPPLEVVFDFRDEALREAWRRAVQAAAPFHTVAGQGEGEATTAPLVLTDRLEWLDRADLHACILVSASALREARLYRPPFLREPNHPLVNGIDWQGCLLAIGEWEGTAYTPQLPRVSGHEAIVIAEVPGGTSRRFILHADLRRSNLPTQAAFPVLAHNAVELARGFQPGLRRTNLRFGERLEFRPPPEAGPLRLTQPDGWEEEVVNPRAIRLPPDRSGLFALRAQGHPPWTFAVNHADAATSDLRAVKAGQYRTRDPAAAAGTLVLHDAWMLLLALLVLALMVSEWRLSGHRRKGRAV